MFPGEKKSQKNSQIEIICRIYNYAYLLTEYFSKFESEEQTWIIILHVIRLSLLGNNEILKN